MGLPPNPMWHSKDWMKQKVAGITKEDIPWWHLVVPMTDRGVEHTLELAKHLLVAWKWSFTVGATEFCPPTPSMMNIGQFLDEDADLHDWSAWMLAYTHTLQCMGEAAEGRHWCPSGTWLSVKVSGLVDAFIMAMGV